MFDNHEHNIEIRNIKSSLRFVNHDVLKTIVQIGPDVIYWFGNSLSGFFLRRLKRLQVPLVLNISAVHFSFSDLQSLSLRDALSHWVHVAVSFPIGRLLVSCLNDTVFSTIIVSSEASRNHLISFGAKSKKIKVAPLVFDLNDPRFEKKINMLEARKQLQLNSRSFIALYLGSANTVRGTDTIVKSANILKSKIEDFKVLILSRRYVNTIDPSENFLHRLITKYELDEQVEIIPGIQNKDNIIDYLIASNIVVLPFKIVPSEPPIAILEAMAMSKAVITSATCGLPEVISLGRGILCSPGDSKDLANAIYYLATNPQITEDLGKEAKNFISLLPGFDSLTKWTLDILLQASQPNLLIQNQSSVQN